MPVTHTDSRPERRSSAADDGLSVSTVVPTVGRDSLHRTVESVLDQTAPGAEVEVVVVNDGASELSPAPWQQSERVQITSTERPRSGPSVARNVGAAESTGSFLHFLDDDDWLLPGAFEAFEEVHRRHPEARWLYGIAEQYTRAGDFLGTLPEEPEGNVLAEIISGEWFPLQATLVDRRLFWEVGGYRSDYLVSEDMDLILRLSLVEDMRRVRTPVCAYSEGVEESETQRERCSEFLFRAYEDLFDRPESLQRAVASADTPHLYGKLLRHYLISLRKNVRGRHFAKVGRRLVDTLRALARSGRWIAVPELWRAVVSPQAGMFPPQNGGEGEPASTPADSRQHVQ